METKNREKLLLIVVGIAAVLWLADVVVFSPLVNSWRARSARIADLEKSIADGSLLLQREETIQDRWDRMRTNTLPANASQAESAMLKAFDRWERSSGVTRGSIKPQLKETDDNYSMLECRADYTGSMTAVSQFLKALEKDPLGLKVESVEITARDDTGQQLALGLEVSGLILGSENSETP